ncbi:hypothetical protein [Acinetobacter sp. HY1485]|uniref:hypothetical protein n=1 Tax=Acinetobacter sp. HY1485 TaxID=2970918 RepID=UPI0022B95E0B|nr:hypothetical protein [Acinetobacter sp. HY1485]
MTAPINFQAIQTIYALEHKKDFFYLRVSPFFLTQFNFDFCIQSLLDIQTGLLHSHTYWDEDELRCLAFYIVEIFARIKAYNIIWEGDFGDYHAVFSDQEQVILNLAIFEDLEQSVVDLIFNLSQEFNIDLIKETDLTTPLRFKATKSTKHLEKVTNLTTKQKQQLYTKKPAWLVSQQRDSLHDYFEKIPTLLERGYKAKAHIVQANQLLFNPDSIESCPAEVVFDLQNRLTYTDLKSIINYLFDLRSRAPETLNSDERRYASHLNHEKDRCFFYQLPYELLGYPLRSSTIFIDRSYLPTRSLITGEIEILLNPEKIRYVMLYPSILWEAEKINEWKALAQAENESPLPKFKLKHSILQVFANIKAVCVEHPIWTFFVLMFVIKIMAAIAKTIE